MKQTLYHRIASGAIVIHKDSVLLVRYPEQYLVAPGGGIELNESLEDAAVRECAEETGVIIKPIRLIVSELMTTSKYLMQKNWFICKYVSGTPSVTEESKIEGITEVGWFTAKALKNEKVFPSIFKTMSFSDMIEYEGSPIIPPLTKANF